ncbi:hypothetical protein WG622_04020 [Cognatishimia sp. D5M38]|uniref:Uncharacterized protein n=1 Tax=Cognatishimia coralii TaxID=3083254 RepID=A0ABU8QD90_9RHOB
MLKTRHTLMPQMPEVLRAVVRKFTKPREDAPLAFLPTVYTDQNVAEGVKIPVNNASVRKCDDAKFREEGQFLARQERWEDLSTRIQEADRARAKSASGTSIAELLLFGGRADVVAAAEHALLHGTPEKDANFVAGIEDMELMLSEHPNDYALALTVAHMHIDIGWAWRGHGALATLPHENREAFKAHFHRAEEIMDAFCAHEMDSPALSAARCALLPAQDHPGDCVSDDFEDLIDLDPQNPRHMRALGNYLLPQWYGGYEKLDLEARRTSARTYDLWGAGGYAWVWFDAILSDPECLAHMDADYFLDGVFDILERQTDQNTANLMAAQVYCAWQASRQNYMEGGTSGAQATVLRKGFEDIIHKHLREVHPLIWGHAEYGFDNRNRSISLERLARKGTDLALNAVAQPFRKMIEQGLTIHIGPEGITEIHP